MPAKIHAKKKNKNNNDSKQTTAAVATAVAVGATTDRRNSCSNGTTMPPPAARSSASSSSSSSSSLAKTTTTTTSTFITPNEHDVAANRNAARNPTTTATTPAQDSLPPTQQQQAFLRPGCDNEDLPEPGKRHGLPVPRSAITQPTVRQQQQPITDADSTPVVSAARPPTKKTTQCNSSDPALALCREDGGRKTAKLKSKQDDTCFEARQNPRSQQAGAVSTRGHGLVSTNAAQAPASDASLKAVYGSLADAATTEEEDGPSRRRLPLHLATSAAFSTKVVHHQGSGGHQKQQECARGDNQERVSSSLAPPTNQQQQFYADYHHQASYPDDGYVGSRVAEQRHHPHAGNQHTSSVPPAQRAALRSPHQPSHHYDGYYCHPNSTVPHDVLPPPPINDSQFGGGMEHGGGGGGNGEFSYLPPSTAHSNEAHFACGGHPYHDHYYSNEYSSSAMSGEYDPDYDRSACYPPTPQHHHQHDPYNATPQQLSPLSRPASQIDVNSFRQLRNRKVTPDHNSDKKKNQNDHPNVPLHVLHEQLYQKEQDALAAAAASAAALALPSDLLGAAATPNNTQEHCVQHEQEEFEEDESFDGDEEEEEPEHCHEPGTPPAPSLPVRQQWGDWHETDYCDENCEETWYLDDPADFDPKKSTPLPQIPVKSFMEKEQVLYFDRGLPDFIAAELRLRRHLTHEEYCSKRMAEAIVASEAGETLDPYGALDSRKCLEWFRVTRMAHREKVGHLIPGGHPEYITGLEVEYTEEATVPTAPGSSHEVDLSQENSGALIELPFEFCAHVNHLDVTLALMYPGSVPGYGHDANGLPTVYTLDPSHPLYDDPHASLKMTREEFEAAAVGAISLATKPKYVFALEEDKFKKDWMPVHPPLTPADINFVDCEDWSEFEKITGLQCGAAFCIEPHTRCRFLYGRPHTYRGVATATRNPFSKQTMMRSRYRSPSPPKRRSSSSNKNKQSEEDSPAAAAAVTKSDEKKGTPVASDSDPKSKRMLHLGLLGPEPRTLREVRFERGNALVHHAHRLAWFPPAFYVDTPWAQRTFKTPVNQNIDGRYFTHQEWCNVVRGIDELQSQGELRTRTELVNFMTTALIRMSEQKWFKLVEMKRLENAEGPRRSSIEEDEHVLFCHLQEQFNAQLAVLSSSVGGRKRRRGLQPTTKAASDSDILVAEVVDHCVLPTALVEEGSEHRKNPARLHTIAKHIGLGCRIDSEVVKAVIEEEDERLLLATEQELMFTQILNEAFLAADVQQDDEDQNGDDGSISASGSLTPQLRPSPTPKSLTVSPCAPLPPPSPPVGAADDERASTTADSSTSSGATTTTTTTTLQIPKPRSEAASIAPLVGSPAPPPLPAPSLPAVPLPRSQARSTMGIPKPRSSCAQEEELSHSSTSCEKKDATVDKKASREKDCVSAVEPSSTDVKAPEPPAATVSPTPASSSATANVVVEPPTTKKKVQESPVKKPQQQPPPCKPAIPGASVVASTTPKKRNKKKSHQQQQAAVAVDVVPPTTSTTSCFSLVDSSVANDVDALAENKVDVQHVVAPAGEKEELKESLETADAHSNNKDDVDDHDDEHSQQDTVLSPVVQFDDNGVVEELPVESNSINADADVVVVMVKEQTTASPEATTKKPSTAVKKKPQQEANTSGDKQSKSKGAAAAATTGKKKKKRSTKHDDDDWELLDALLQEREEEEEQRRMVEETKKKKKKSDVGGDATNTNKKKATTSTATTAEANEDDDACPKTARNVASSASASASSSPSSTTVVDVKGMTSFNEFSKKHHHESSSSSSVCPPPAAAAAHKHRRPMIRQHSAPVPPVPPVPIKIPPRVRSRKEHLNFIATAFSPRDRQDVEAIRSFMEDRFPVISKATNDFVNKGVFEKMLPRLAEGPTVSTTAMVAALRHATSSRQGDEEDDSYQVALPAHCGSSSTPTEARVSQKGMFTLSELLHQGTHRAFKKALDTLQQFREEIRSCLEMIDALMTRAKNNLRSVMSLRQQLKKKRTAGKDEVEAERSSWLVGEDGGTDDNDLPVTWPSDDDDANIVGNYDVELEKARLRVDTIRWISSSHFCSHIKPTMGALSPEEKLQMMQVAGLSYDDMKHKRSADELTWYKLGDLLASTTSEVAHANNLYALSLTGVLNGWDVSRSRMFQYSLERTKCTQLQHLNSAQLRAEGGQHAASIAKRQEQQQLPPTRRTKRAQRRREAKLELQMQQQGAEDDDHNQGRFNEESSPSPGSSGPRLIESHDDFLNELASSQVHRQMLAAVVETDWFMTVVADLQNRYKFSLTLCNDLVQPSSLGTFTHLHFHNTDYQRELHQMIANKAVGSSSSSNSVSIEKFVTVYTLYTKHVTACSRFTSQMGVALSGVLSSACYLRPLVINKFLSNMLHDVIEIRGGCALPLPQEHVRQYQVVLHDLFCKYVLDYPQGSNKTSKKFSSRRDHICGVLFDDVLHVDDMDCDDDGPEVDADPSPVATTIGLNESNICAMILTRQLANLKDYVTSMSLQFALAPAVPLVDSRPITSMSRSDSVAFDPVRDTFFLTKDDPRDGDDEGDITTTTTSKSEHTAKKKQQRKAVGRKKKPTNKRPPQQQEEQRDGCTPAAEEEPTSSQQEEELEMQGIDVDLVKTSLWDMYHALVAVPTLLLQRATAAQWRKEDEQQEQDDDDNSDGVDDPTPIVEALVADRALEENALQIVLSLQYAILLLVARLPPSHRYDSRRDAAPRSALSSQTIDEVDPTTSLFDMVVASMQVTFSTLLRYGDVVLHARMAIGDAPPSARELNACFALTTTLSSFFNRLHVMVSQVEVFKKNEKGLPVDDRVSKLAAAAPPNGGLTLKSVCDLFPFFDDMIASLGADKTNNPKKSVFSQSSSDPYTLSADTKAMLRSWAALPELAEEPLFSVTRLCTWPKQTNNSPRHSRQNALRHQLCCFTRNFTSDCVNDLHKLVKVNPSLLHQATCVHKLFERVHLMMACDTETTQKATTTRVAGNNFGEEGMPRHEEQQKASSSTAPLAEFCDFLMFHSKMRLFQDAIDTSMFIGACPILVDDHNAADATASRAQLSDDLEQEADEGEHDDDDFTWIKRFIAGCQGAGEEEEEETTPVVDAQNNDKMSDEHVRRVLLRLQHQNRAADEILCADDDDEGSPTATANLPHEPTTSNDNGKNSDEPMANEVDEEHVDEDDNDADDDDGGLLFLHNDDDAINFCDVDPQDVFREALRKSAIRVPPMTPSATTTTKQQQQQQLDSSIDVEDAGILQQIDEQCSKLATTASHPPPASSSEDTASAASRSCEAPQPPATQVATGVDEEAQQQQRRLRDSRLTETDMDSLFALDEPDPSLQQRNREIHHIFAALAESEEQEEEPAAVVSHDDDDLSHFI